MGPFLSRSLLEQTGILHGGDMEDCQSIESFIQLDLPIVCRYTPSRGVSI